MERRSSIDGYCNWTTVSTKLTMLTTVNSASAEETSDYGYLMADGHSREFIWACELSKEKRIAKWEIDADDGDSDFLCHTLFLKQAVLGASAVDDETNIVSVETKDFYMQNVKQPIVSLTSGVTNSCMLDLNFSSEIPVTFHLTSGNGPVYITGAHLVEFPPETEEAYDPKLYESTARMLNKAAEKETTAAEQPDDEVKFNSKKRKANTAPDTKEKRKKLEDSNEMEQENGDNGFQDPAEQDDDQNEDEEESDDDGEDEDGDDAEVEEDEDDDDASESTDEDYSVDSDDDDYADSDAESDEEPKPQKSSSNKGQTKSGTKGNVRASAGNRAAEQKLTMQMQSKPALPSKTTSKKKPAESLSKKSPADNSATGKSRRKKSK